MSNKAILKSNRLQNLVTTLLFDILIASHDNHLLPLLLVESDFHQYSFMILSIAWHKILGIKKHNMQHNEIAWAALLSMKTVPALERKLLLHP